MKSEFRLLLCQHTNWPILSRAPRGAHNYFFHLHAGDVLMRRSSRHLGHLRPDRCVDAPRWYTLHELVVESLRGAPVWISHYRRSADVAKFYIVF